MKRVFFLTLFFLFITEFGFSQPIWLKKPIQPVPFDSIMLEDYFWNEARTLALKADSTLKPSVEKEMTFNRKSMRKQYDSWMKRTADSLSLLGGIGPLTAGSPLQSLSSMETVRQSWNLYLWTGDAKYLDVLERAMYNGVRSSLSIDGNPYIKDGAQMNYDFVGYMAATQGRSIYLNLLTRSTISVHTDSLDVKILLDTSMPWFSRVLFRIILPEGVKHRFSLCLRVPGWVRGEVLPVGNRYGMTDKTAYGSININGEATIVRPQNGYIIIDREWTNGETVHWDQKTPIKRIRKVKDGEQEKGLFAFQRGPIVYSISRGSDVGFLDVSDPVDMEYDKVVRHVEVLSGNMYKSDGTVIPDGYKAVPYYKGIEEFPEQCTVWYRERK